MTVLIRRHPKVKPQRPYLHHAGVDAFEMMNPKADHLPDEIRLGRRHPLIRIKMRPRPHQYLERTHEVFGIAKGVLRHRSAQSPKK